MRPEGGEGGGRRGWGGSKKLTHTGFYKANRVLQTGCRCEGLVKGENKKELKGLSYEIDFKNVDEN